MRGLRGFADDVWIADGPNVRFWGISFPTRAIIVKLGDGSLWVNSPITATRREAASLERFGPIAQLVSPTQLHDWRLELWSTFFPRAQVWKARTLTDVAPAAWSADIDQLVFQGSRVLSEVEFFHRRSRTLIVGDFIQNFPYQSHRPILNALKRIGGVLGAGTPRDLRWSFAGARARRLGREAVRRLLDWDFDKVVVAHGEPITSHARLVVEKALRWL